MKKIKKLILLFLAIFSCFIVGCEKNNTNKINFDIFNLQVDQDFGEIATSLINNKQIINKILKAYKKKSESGFKENIIITKNSLKRNLTSQEYSEINAEKLKQKLAGFQLREKNNFNFTCRNEKLDVYYLVFQFTPEILQDNPSKYLIFQLYFVYKDQAYIISFANSLTDTNYSSIVKNYLSSSQSITCN